MFVWTVVVWVAGLLTLVPFGTYYLLFHAERDQYALLITLVLFWIFGFWGVAGPILSAVKVRALFRSLERARSRGELREALLSPESREAAVDFIATENHIPRFLATRVWRLLERRLAVEIDAAAASPRGGRRR